MTTNPDKLIPIIKHRRCIMPGQPFCELRLKMLLEPLNDCACSCLSSAVFSLFDPIQPAGLLPVVVRQACTPFMQETYPWQRMCHVTT